MILRVLYYDEQELRAKGDKITIFDEALAKTVEDMKETLYEQEGLGLAAQQVGLPLQLAVIDLRILRGNPDYGYRFTIDSKTIPSELLYPLVVINAEIEAISKELTCQKESCLSLPGIEIAVPRPEEIKVTYQDLEGIRHTLICNGILARCIQHEVDHNNGTLIIDHAERREVHALATKLKQLKRVTRDRLKALSKKRL